LESFAKSRLKLTRDRKIQGICLRRLQAHRGREAKVAQEKHTVKNKKVAVKSPKYNIKRAVGLEGMKMDDRSVLTEQGFHCANSKSTKFSW
jgi:hypothetical protein